MNYNEALDYIFGLPKFSYPLGNENLSKLLSVLGSPQKDLKFIHIAGTNGKGSAAAMLASVLEKSGYKTGLFTSPFIRRFNERIQINSVQIPDSELAAVVRTVSAASTGAKVSQFAFILACAFVYYSREKCDFVVLEAGLGGRLDATNVIEESVLSVIMSVSLDHTEYLGSTVAEIAAEKSGIIKDGGRVVVYRNSEEADSVIKAACAEKSAKYIKAPPAEKTESGFRALGRDYTLSLGGGYQAGNAAVVLAAVEEMRKMGIEISEKALVEGFANCRWQGRFERVRDNVIVDGGHNPDGLRALCDSIAKLDGRKTAVVAMMEDKAVGECLDVLCRHFDKIIATELEMPRCMRAGKLAGLAAERGTQVELVPDLNKAFAMAEDNTDGLSVVCGSIFLAGRALEYFYT